MITIGDFGVSFGVPSFQDPFGGGGSAGAGLFQAAVDAVGGAVVAPAPAPAPVAPLTATLPLSQMANSGPSAALRFALSTLAPPKPTFRLNLSSGTAGSGPSSAPAPAPAPAPAAAPAYAYDRAVRYTSAADEDNGIPTVALVAGGVAVAGLAAFLLLRKR